METIIREGSPKTPHVIMNGETGQIEIKGRSIPENSGDFYRLLLDWVDKYVENPCDTTIFNAQMEYFNTSSSKCILSIMKKLEALYKSGKKVKVNWYAEEDDEDMISIGEDYQACLTMPIELVLIEE